MTVKAKLHVVDDVRTVILATPEIAGTLTLPKCTSPHDTVVQITVTEVVVEPTGPAPVKP